MVEDVQHTYLLGTVLYVHTYLPSLVRQVLSVWMVASGEIRVLDTGQNSNDMICLAYANANCSRIIHDHPVQTR